MTITANYPAIRPSLLLDFANEQALDPRITFSRPTTGTYYNGYSSAVAEQNLLTYSQAFAPGATSWSAYGGGTVTVTDNVTTAPDGTTTASSLIGGAASGTYKTIVSSNSFSASTAITASIYVKANGYNYLVFVAAGGNGRAVIDFATPANNVVYAGSFTITSTSVGSGWYRVTVSFTSGSAAAVWFGSIPTIADPAIAFTSNGTSGIYIWGAQLEQRSAVTAYTATTTTAITNYISVLQTGAINQARFDHDPVLGTSLGLLIEQQSTNLLTYSADLTNSSGWTNTAITVTGNTNIAPDGTQTACKLIPTTANTNHGNNTVQTLTVSTVYAVSFYAKSSGYNYIAVNQSGAGAYGANFNLSNGTASLGTSATSASMTSVGNGWYKCQVVFTAAYAQLRFYVNTTSGFFGDSYAGDGFSGIYIWGAQLEALAFPTSYIPTVASQVTRSADSASMTGTNFSSWFNQQQGTLYAETRQVPNVYTGIMTLASSTLTRIGLYKFSNNIVYTDAAIVSVNQAAFTLGTVSTQVAFKASFSYQTNNFAGSLNGATAVTGSTGTVPPNITYLTIGQPVDSTTVTGSQTIKKLAYYPIALSSANITALTGS